MASTPLKQDLQWVPVGRCAACCKALPHPYGPMIDQVVGSASRKNVLLLWYWASISGIPKYGHRDWIILAVARKKCSEIPWRLFFYKWSDAAVCDNKSVTPLMQLKYVVLLSCWQYIVAGTLSQLPKLQQDHKFSSYTTYFFRWNDAAGWQWVY